MPCIIALSQRRIRNWALGSRRTVGLPAVFDAESQQYFLLIRAAEGADDCFLASFSEESSVKLDEAPKLIVLPSVLATFPATAAGSRAAVGRPRSGGVLVVLRQGAVRWLRPDGTDQCPAQSGSDAARAVAAGAIHGADGSAIVAVVRTDSGKEGASQSVDLYTAGSSGVAPQLRHTASATLDASAGACLPLAHVSTLREGVCSPSVTRSCLLLCEVTEFSSLRHPPPGRTGPVAAVAPLDSRSVAVLSADGTLRVLRSAGAAAGASAPAQLAQASSSQLGCFLRQQPAEAAPRPSKRKAADAGKAAAAGAQPGGSGLALCPCPGDYLLVSGEQASRGRMTCIALVLKALGVTAVAQARLRADAARPLAAQPQGSRTAATSARRSPWRRR